MKRIAFLLLVIILTIMYVSLFRKRFEENSTTPPASFTSPILPSALSTFPSHVIEINYGNQLLQMYVVEIPPTANLMLIPNFTEKEFGETIVTKNGCIHAINGGFYKTDGKPLGLFKIQEKTLGKEVTSSLVNGFFWQEKSGKRTISNKKPGRLDTVKFIFQTGPLAHVGEYKLQLINDNNSRRSLLANDRNDKLYMIKLVDKENTRSGPLLSDIPNILFQPKVQETYPFVTMLNLDGGSASFFYTKDQNGPFVLSELTPIGSLLCME